MRVNLNSDISWATLKGLVRVRGPAELDLPALPWCAPLVLPPSGPGCRRTDALCIVFALSITSPDRYTARPVSSMPPGVPVIAAMLRDYPKRRHIAISHLTFVVDSYDELPLAVALLFDHGDKHVLGGADVCAQAVHMADVARMLGSGALRGRRAHKSLSPHPSPVAHSASLTDGGTAAQSAVAASNGSDADGLGVGSSTFNGHMRGFRCVRHVLLPAERAAWHALLAAHLGPPPRAIFSYAGNGEMLLTREALQSLPRTAYAALLRTLLSRSSPHADTLNALMPRVWGALVGGAFTRAQGFVCDHERGWGQPRAESATVDQQDLQPALRRPSLSPHDETSAAGALKSFAPIAPSRRELATNCGPSSLLCVVVAAHKENLKWLKRIGHPTLVYHRHVHSGLYVTPNVFHEHAVYLRFICAFYHQLPKLAVFLHGHHTSWHNRNSPAVDQLLRTDLNAAARAGKVYRSFNDYSQCWRDHEGEWGDEMLGQLQGWTREMRPLLGEPPGVKESYCCTQFLVSADRIRSRPLSFWRRLLADLLDPAVPPVCKVSGHLLELTWGYLLGEPANATCRRDGWGADGQRG